MRRTGRCDDVPDAPVVPVSRVATSGPSARHRLICGDATDPATVATLMAGRASPPFHLTALRQPAITPPAAWDGLMRGVFIVANGRRRPGC